MSPLYWLASYPKSGNTWFRIFLTNLLMDGDAPAAINELVYTPIASDPILFEEAVGYPASCLTDDEIEWLRPQAYAYYAATSGEATYWKIHDALRYFTNGVSNVPPPPVTTKVLYLVRNPLDVVVSLGAFLGETDIDATIGSMGKEDYAFCAKRDRHQPQLKQMLLSWSRHVASWVDQTFLPVHVVRYEDMQEKPFETFRAAAVALDLPTDRERVEKAIRFSEFKQVKAQEEKSGFEERPASSKAFFRKGKSGGWRDVLTSEQVMRVVTDHRDMMARFGYLDGLDV